MRDSVQVHVFGDPGMEMMPESGGCMCYKHNKKIVLERFHFFHLFTILVSGGKVLGIILTPFGDLGGTVLIIEGIGSRLEILWFFRDSLGGAQILGPHQVEGNVLVQGGSRLQPRNILAVKYKPISCKFTSFQRMHL